MKGKIKGLINDELFLWYSLEPTDITLGHLDRIAIEVDEDYHEGINKKKQFYRSFLPKRFVHRHKDSVYAISIFNKDMVDFILFKKSPVFNEVHTLIDGNFKLVKPVTKQKWKLRSKSHNRKN